MSRARHQTHLCGKRHPAFQAWLVLARPIAIGTIGTLCTWAQSAPIAVAETASFEVASIRPNNSARGLSGGSCHGTDSTYSGALGIAPPPLGRCVMRRVTLKTLIKVAYDLGFLADTDNLVSGGPNWLDTQGFDLEAKAPEPRTEAQLKRMLQGLLADRFKLKVHPDPRDGAGYALLVAKNGPKLTQASADAPQKGLQRIGQGPLNAQNASMAQLAKALSGTFARPVVDETGLTGGYDFTLTWTPGDNEIDPLAGIPAELLAQLPARAVPSGPSIFTALQEQLGLRLETRKFPVQVLVVDHAEKPSEN
jgi:bla regulator protein blaR1